MTVRDVVLHSAAIITSTTHLRIIQMSADGVPAIIAEGTKYEDAILAQGEREIVWLFYDAAIDSAEIWVACKEADEG